MENTQFFFILAFILVQSAVGIALLCRGLAPVFEDIKAERLTGLKDAAVERLKATVSASGRYIGTLTGSFLSLRRGLMLVLLVVPGSVFLLLGIAMWRLVRRLEISMMLKLSTRRLKTALQNIAL